MTLVRERLLRRPPLPLGWRPRADTTLIVAAYVVLSLAVYRQLLGHLGESLPGGADGVLYAWYFEWTRHSILGLHNPLFSLAINAPHGVNVMWNTSLLALAIPCLPLIQWAGPFTTVGMLFMMAPGVSATAAFVVLRRIFGSTSGAAPAGLLYGFGPFFVGHFGHLNLIFAPLPVIAVGLIHRLLFVRDADPRRDGIVLGVVLACQLLVSEELLVLFLVAGVIAIVSLAITDRPTLLAGWTTLTRGLGVAAGVAFAIAVVPIGFQILGPQASPGGLRAGPARADLSSFVRPGVLERFASHADRHASFSMPGTNGAENTAFLGWPLVLLVVAAAAWTAWRGSRFARWWLLTTAAVVVLSLGSPVGLNGHRLWYGPWAIAHHLPLIASAQAVRLSLVTTLLVGGFIAWFVGTLRGRRRILALALVGLALIPLWPTEPYRVDRLPATPTFFTSRDLRTVPTGTNVLVLPIPHFPHVDAMVWQIRAHMRFNLVGGYSVFDNGRRANPYVAHLPAPIFMINGDLPAPTPTPQRRAALRDALRGMKVRLIVITNQLTDPAGTAASVAAYVGCTLRQVDNVQLCDVPTSN